MDDILGRVLAVTGSQMRAQVTADRFTEASIRIGAMIKVQSADLDVVGAISAAELDSTARILLSVDLLGEISPSEKGRAQFHRGVSCHPIPGAPVRAATSVDLTAVYTRPAASNVSVGSLYHDAGRPAFVLVDEFLAKNFAVLGATGSGKSCAVTLMLSAVLTDHPNAHIIVLDPHNEYANAFGERAELFNVDNLVLPLWLLDFEEAVGVLVRGGTVQDQETQAIILKDAIIRARRPIGATQRRQSRSIRPCPSQPPIFCASSTRRWASSTTPTRRRLTCGSEPAWNRCEPTGGTRSCSPTRSPSAIHCHGS
jgi:hypothetical protein